MTQEVGLPRAARLFVGGTVLVGLTVLVSVLVRAGSWSHDDALGALTVAGLLVVAERFWITLRHRTETENFDVTEAVFALGLVLVRPGPMLLGVAVGFAVGQLFWRIPAYKIAFNVGQHLVGLGAATLIYGAIADASTGRYGSWLGVIAGMAVYFVINQTAVALIVSLVERTRFTRVLAGPLGISAAQWAGNVALGLLATLVWMEDRLALPALVAPLVLTYLTFRSWIQTRRETEQMREMALAAVAISQQEDLGRRMPETDETPAVTSLASTLNRMLERLEAAFHRERRFIRDASHELRTPVTITRGYLELLGPAPEPTEVQEAVGVAMEELDRMGRLITDLTTLAKADDPGFVVPDSIDLDGFLDRIAAKVRSVLEGRLRYEPAPRGAVVHGDEQRLTQALLNLLQNAVVHTDGDASIELRAIPLAGVWRFEVADQGGGLPAGEEDLVFQPFRRLNGDRPGSGLGLAIVKGIAEGHGGRAGVDNRPGEGATFWIEVPR